MHWWKKEEDDYLRELLSGGFSFSQTAFRFGQRFRTTYTSSMISGRANRLGLCQKRQRVQHVKDAARKSTSFIQEAPMFNGLVSVSDAPELKVVAGYLCKWPTATGDACAEPAGATGYCSKHSTIVHKCVSRARMEGV